MSSAVAHFLFASPSFSSGVARLLDFHGTFDAYNECRNGDEADSLAMFCDWRIVGDTLSEAIQKFAAEVRIEQA